jgi:hypothetical protein
MRGAANASARTVIFVDSACRAKRAVTARKYFRSAA